MLQVAYSQGPSASVSFQLSMLDQLNTGWCTPGVHAPEATGVNRRQRDAGFTLRMVILA